MKQEAVKATDELLQNYCYAGLKETAEKWLKEEATDDEYIAVLKDSIVPVDGAIAFFKTDDALAKFGAETVKKFGAHMQEIKEAGAKYCDCPACTKALEILHALDVEW